MARPRGGEWLETEVSGWKTAGISLVASALTDEEMQELDLGEEPALCASHGIEFARFPVPDRGLPHSVVEWGSFIDRVAAAVKAEGVVVAHCRMGIGRASMIALSVMVEFGVTLDRALELMIEARRRPIPDTAEQLEWIADFARFRRSLV